jgi:hypothetical protein
LTVASTYETAIPRGVAVLLFRDLYNLVEKEVSEPPVRFEQLRSLINHRHAGVGEIKVYAIKYPVPNHQAHYIMTGVDRSSGYDEEFITAEIRYCEELDKEPKDRRFALTKELMHVFDNDSEMTNTREKFVRLVSEIQNQPLPEHASDMYNSEIVTKWMALVILCPKHIRAMYLDDYRSRRIAGFEIAEKLQLPEDVIQYLMDDYYETVFESLMKKS